MKNKIIKKYLLIILLLSQALAAQELSWPEVTKETKPWTRWWWPGSIVTADDLTAAMEKYREAGLGGMEITVLYGVRGQEDKFVKYLSPNWMEMFTYTLKEAGRLTLELTLPMHRGGRSGDHGSIPLMHARI